MSDDKKDVSKVVLQELEGEGTGSGMDSLEYLSDLELPIRVEFSRIKMSLNEVMGLKKGDIVKLNRFAGESVDVYVGERLFAKGEIVVVDDRFGVRILEMVAPEEELE